MEPSQLARHGGLLTGRRRGRPPTLTEQQAQDAAARIDRGEDPRTLAHAWGVHPDTVRARAAPYREVRFLNAPLLSVAQLYEAADRRDAGASWDELAGHYQVTINYLHERVRPLCRSMSRPPARTARIHTLLGLAADAPGEIFARWEGGIPISQLFHIYGVPKKDIRQHIAIELYNRGYSVASIAQALKSDIANTTRLILKTSVGID